MYLILISFPLTGAGTLGEIGGRPRALHGDTDPFISAGPSFRPSPRITGRTSGAKVRDGALA